MTFSPISGILVVVSRLSKVLRAEFEGVSKVKLSLVGKQFISRVVVVSKSGPRLLKLVLIKEYGTKIWELLDSGAVPDVM